MMAVTAARMFAFIACFLFGAAGAAGYCVAGLSGKAIPHAVLWCGLALLLQPGRNETEEFNEWIDAKLREEGIEVRP